MSKILGWAVFAGLALITTLSSVVTYFPETNIGSGIIAKSQATIASGSTYLDVIIQNTSNLSLLISGKRANPFIVTSDSLVINRCFITLDAIT